LTLTNEETTVSVRITKELSLEFRNSLTQLGITRSEFLKACIERISKGSMCEKELTLAAIGFSKKEQWTK
jgi:antitoxin component of RelBE/YafQ-DinJ toxin-antitoxin module